MSTTATRDLHLAHMLDEAPNWCGMVQRRNRAATCCLRHRFQKLEQDGATAGDIAAWAGYLNKNRADGTRVRRLLGIEPNRHRARGRSPSYTTTVPYADAVKLALAMGLDPVDIGL